MITPLFADAESIANANLVVAKISLFATIGLTILTAIYVILTRRLVRFQTEPCVVVYMQLIDAGKVCVVVENVGGGLAQDIRFEPYSHTQAERWRKFIDAPRLGGPPMQETAIGTGIPALPARGRRVVYWGSWSDFREAFGRGLLLVCRFRRADHSEAHPMSCILEVVSLDGSVPEA